MASPRIFLRVRSPSARRISSRDGMAALPASKTWGQRSSRNCSSVVTSRNAPDELKNFGARCVFDLDENRSYCVHDYDIPAEEELLTLHCLLSVPGYENWARAMRDDSPEGRGSGDLDALLAGV